VTPSTALSGGSYKFYIKTWNSKGFGPWSSGKSFSVSGSGASKPSAATLISPSGSISDSTPTYKWKVGSGATWYYLWVGNSSGKKIGKWYSASNCASGTCSVTPSTALSSGSYKFYIKTWNSRGFGPWSSGKSFSVSSF
ncbi:MAG: hypothetical protein KAG20_09425, partial [Cocleimonas sp.]|nr:hypothetical protein [Cocleimonas sp.]